MALEEVTLPKTYKNGKILFEKDLDNFRLAAEEAFANIQLNFTQLAKDVFSVGYEYGNNGGQIKFPSIEDRLAQFEGGGAEIAGTASDTFTINTDGNSATLDTASLTGNHTYLFPDVDGTFMLTDAIQSVTGAKTFTSLALKVLATGGGTGVASFVYVNSNNNRSYTIPDVSLDASFVMTEGAQTISGIKRFINTIQASNTTAIDLMALGNRIVFDEDDDTFIRANIDDQLVFTTNNVDRVFFSNTAALFNVTIACGVTNAIDLITLGNKIILDADDDTSLRCPIDDSVVFEIGAVDRVTFGTTTAAFAITVAANLTNAFDVVANGNRVILDADDDTYLSCNADDSLQFTIGGTVRLTGASTNFTFAVPAFLPIQDPPITNGTVIATTALSTLGLWLTYDDGTAILANSYNVANVLDNDGDGFYQVTFDTALEYAFQTAIANGTSLSNAVGVSTCSATTVSVTFYNVSGVATDGDFNVMVGGA